MTKLPADHEKSDFFRDAIIVFSFLEALGLRAKARSDTLLEYVGDRVSAFIYHGRQSYELGFEIVYDNTRYSISELIRVCNESAGEKYRNPVAKTPDEVRRGLVKLRDLAVKYATNPINGDLDILLQLDAQRTRWAQDLESKTRVSSIRPRADEAFRSKKYAEAAELYEQIRESLTPSQSRKADMARERASL